MLELLPPRLRIHATDGGGVVLESTASPGPAARCVGDWLVRWARERPDQTFLAERDASGVWVRWSYAGALAAIERVEAGLLALGARPDRPLMIVSDNSVDAALIALAAMLGGVPVAPVSSAYSLQSRSFDRLREVASQLRPGLVFADDADRFAPALATLPDDVTVIASRAGRGRGLDELIATPRAPALDRAFAALGPDTIAKVLFTSGSTGRPKGVVNTQRMLTSNQESLAACWPFVARRPPVVVDWLPWSHTFGGNHNFFLVLRNGGTLYVDRGRPAPGLIETTIANLADVSPTMWFNVPRGFDQAVAMLEADPAAAARVFANLDLVFYAAAALGPATRARLEQVAAAAGRRDVFFTSAWGSTETSPLATSAHFETRTTGILGLPVPGVQVKLAPIEGRFELRVRGANVTPGTWQPGGASTPLARAAGGGGAPRAPRRHAAGAPPGGGRVFVGRLGENFKLSSGTWINVAEIRIALVEACAPLVLDAVIAGHDRDALGALLFPTAAARQLAPDVLRARLAAGLAAYDDAHPATSERVARVLVSDDPLSLDDGESTDKGYTNQHRVLERRRAEITRLFAEPAGNDVVTTGS